MNRELDKVMQALAVKLDRLDMLEISGGRWTVSGDPDKFSYRSTNFPEYDICEMPLAERFNVIIAEQVWEHLLFPYRAGKNVYAMLQEGGYFIISVPFLYPMHGHPVDCNRWSPVGLQSFLVECGWQMDKVWVDFWGNRECIKAHLDCSGTPIPYVEDKHSLENEPDFPVMVWAIAQK